MFLDTHLPIPKQNPKDSTVNDGRGGRGTLEFRARDLQVCLCRDCSDRAPRLADSRRVCFEYAARPFRHTSSDLGSACGRPLTPFPCFPVLPGSGLVSGLQKVFCRGTRGAHLGRSALLEVEPPQEPPSSDWFESALIGG